MKITKVNEIVSHYMDNFGEESDTKAYAAFVDDLNEAEENFEELKNSTVGSLEKSSLEFLEAQLLEFQKCECYHVWDPAVEEWRKENRK